MVVMAGVVVVVVQVGVGMHCRVVPSNVRYSGHVFVPQVLVLLNLPWLLVQLHSGLALCPRW
jgi:hypothetical protein